MPARRGKPSDPPELLPLIGPAGRDRRAKKGTYILLMTTLVRLWGLKSPSERKHQMLVNFLDLVTACKLAMMRRTTPARIKEFQEHMHRYLETTKTLYIYSALTPNHHLSLHLPQIFDNFGPPHAWACFVFERCLRWLKFIKTSNKFGKL